MNINVETKFNIGDAIYAPLVYACWIPKSISTQITDIEVRYNTHKGIQVFYVLADRLGSIPENMCFTSYEECKQWCWEQNEKDGLL
jgi:hypothetical protein